jgi:C4-dicarboxylate-specific signal transduction histidine kinase
MRVLLSVCAVAILTFVSYRVIRVNAITAGFAYLLLVLVIASRWELLESVLTAVVATLAFDFFFVPPILGFTPTNPEDWVALFSFLAASLIASHLSATAKRRASEAIRAEQALRRAQADLERVSRVITLGELTASIAHEINQPISAVLTNARTGLRWLKRDYPDLEEASEALSRVVKDVTRVAELITGLRTLFKQGSPRRESIDVNDAVREMIVLLGGETRRHAISVRTELAADLPQILADRVQLQQVLMNLMINAIDAMGNVDGTRELIIKSQPAEDNQLQVSVSDTGVGLPTHQTDQIFKPFFTTKIHGTGMGLRISQSIVERHGGRLWAADNSPCGATFYLTLPTKPGPPE